MRPLTLLPVAFILAAPLLAQGAPSTGLPSAEGKPSFRDTVMAVLAQEHAPTPQNFDELVAHIAPKPSELRWRAIPWRTTLTNGFQDATAADKPILLWTMNGHPLGST